MADGRTETSVQPLRQPSHAERLLAARYGDGKRANIEREPVAESYLALDVRLPTGEFRGFFYYDLDGAVTLDAEHAKLTIPYRDARVIIHGVRLVALYRAVLHHSLDRIEQTHRAEFAVERGEDPVITRIVIEEETKDD